MLGALALHVERSDFDDWRRYVALGIAAIGLTTSYVNVYRCLFPTLDEGQLSVIYFWGDRETAPTEFRQEVPRARRR
jgi:hypothetical protein